VCATRAELMVVVAAAIDDVLRGVVGLKIEKYVFIKNLFRFHKLVFIKINFNSS
jgi:hypothetical protein